MTTFPEWKNELIKQLGLGGENSESGNQHQSLAAQVASFVNGIKAAIGDIGYGNLLTVGEETFPRPLINNSLAASSGQLRLTYFTARKTETITQVRIITFSGGAAATPTLCRMGLYSIDSSGAGTLVASTPNDTSLFSTASTPYTKSFSVPYTKIAGTRYAFGYLVVTGVGVPNFVGTGTDVSPGGRAEFAVAPRLAGILGSQSDLPNSFTDVALSTIDTSQYAVLLP